MLTRFGWLPPPRKLLGLALACAIVAESPSPAFYAAAADLKSPSHLSDSRVAVFQSLRAALSEGSGAGAQGAMDDGSTQALDPGEKEKIQLLVGSDDAFDRGDAPASMPPALVRGIVVELRRTLGPIPAQALLDDANREKVLAMLEERLPTRHDIDSPIRSRLDKLGRLIRREFRMGYPGDPAHARQQWESDREKLVPEVMSMSRQVEDLAQNLKTKSDPDKFKQALDTNQIVVNNPSFGKAEMTVLDGEHGIRVTHNASQLSFVIVDPRKVDLASAHLRRYLDRQLIDAGKSRWDFEEGRDAVLVLRHGDQVKDTKYFARPRPWTAAWWTSNWRATWKAPTWRDFGIQGIFWGVAHGSLAWILIAIKLYIQGPVDASSMPSMVQWLGWSVPSVAVFTFVYSTVFGTINSAYNNWNTRGRSRNRQLVKGAIFMSLPFALAVIWLDAGLASMNPLTLVGLWGIFHLFFNLVLNNIGKVAWYRIPQIGDANQRYVVPLPVLGSRRTFVFQTYYTVNWVFRLFDLLFPKWVSMPLFLAGVAFAYWRAADFAKSNGYPEAPAARRQWERIKNAILWAPRLITRPWRASESSSKK